MKNPEARHVRVALAKKLQVKDGQKVRVVNAPRGFELDALTTRAASADAVLVFVKDRAELDAKAEPALAAAREDRLAWIAYPKGGAARDGPQPGRPLETA